MDQKCNMEAELFKIASIIPNFMKNMAEEGFEFKLKTQKDDEITGKILSEMISTLQSVHNYFVRMQNRLQLTVEDEKLWKKVAYCLELVKLKEKE